MAAIVWGAWAPNSTTNKRLRLGLELTYSGNPATGGVTVTKKLYAQCRWRIYDQYNTCHITGVGGTYSGAVSAIFPASDTTIHLKTTSSWETLTYGSTQTKSASASLTGVQYIGAGHTASVSASITLPARPYDVPVAPTIGTATRQSDTRALVTWTRNVATNRPYTAVHVLRDWNNTGFVQIARLSGTASSYVDTTTRANSYYRYRVRASNPAGSATSASTNYIYNTPARPRDVVAVKTDVMEVTISFHDTSNTETAFEWERTEDDGVSWDPIGTTGSGVATFVDTDPPGGEIRYRVRATRGALVSAWGYSNSVTTITPPDVPNVESWSAYTATGTTLRLAWKHNTLDGSEQTKADIEWSIDDVGDDDTIVSSQQYYDIPIGGASATDEVKARVRTYGIHEDPGPWSDWVETVLADVPQVNIVVPADDEYVLIDTPLLVEWDYVDDFPQVVFQLSLYDEFDNLIAYWTGSDATSQVIEDEYLENESSYRLVLVVRSGSGFSSEEAERTFETDFLAPNVPSVFATWYPETLSAEIVGYVTEDPPEWEPETEYEEGDKVTVNGAVYVCTKSGVSGEIEPEWSTEETVQDGSEEPPSTDGYIDVQAPAAVGSRHDAFAREVGDTKWQLIVNRLVEEMQGLDLVAHVDGDILYDWSEYPSADCEEDLRLRLEGDLVQIIRLSDSEVVHSVESSLVPDAGDWRTDPVEAEIDYKNFDYVEWEYEADVLPEAIRMALLRIDEVDGVQEIEMLVDPYVSGSTVIDYTPALEQSVTYRVRAIAANGAYSHVDVQIETIAAGYFAVNFGDGNADLLKLKWNPRNTLDAEDNAEIMSFAGREDPVLFSGEHTIHGLEFVADSISVKDMVTFRRLKEWKKATIWRAPDGQRATIKWLRLSEAHTHSKVQQFSFSGQEVE